MDKELIATLLGWAATLSGYDVPSAAPEIAFRPHPFFVQEVCAGRECRAVGWYDDDRGVVFIDERFREVTGPEVASLYVHELVHFLQHHSGRFDSHSCRDATERERQALAVQNEYLLQQSASVARFWTVDEVTCRYDHRAPGGGRPGG